MQPYDPYKPVEISAATPAQSGAVEPFNPWLVTPAQTVRAPRPRRGFWDWMAVIVVGILKGSFWLVKYLATVLWYAAIVVLVLLAFASIIAIPIGLSMMRSYTAPRRVYYY